jgi:choline dehydrogenase
VNPDKGRKVSFAERVHLNQQQLASHLKSNYDFIICGSGSSGSVVARRLAENPEVNVLLLEAGGSRDVPEVMEEENWPANLGSERDWNFQGQPNSRVNSRSIPFSMGKVSGGGSSINAMVWARGHKNDWDFFASEAGDPAWNYDSVLNIYRRIEDWHGLPDPEYRGTGGPVYVRPAPNPNPIAPGIVQGARSIGIPTFENPNGRMMEGEGGASISDVRLRDGKRQSVFRSYTFPYMDRPNLTVLSHALVTRLTFEGKKTTGVEIRYEGKTRRIGAALDVVLSLGAIQTPKVLMQSGIGDQGELQRLGIPVIQHLPGVGQNLQDHAAFDSVWEYRKPLPPRINFSEAIFFWKSEDGLDYPDLFAGLAEFQKSTPENAARLSLPAAGWILFGAIAHPKSRGRIRLTGPNSSDPLRIDTNALSHPDDLKTAIALLRLCREIGNSDPVRRFTKHEVMPGNLKGTTLQAFIRDAATSFWDQTCTAKMGRDAMSVVDGNLKVYGIDNLRVADGSIMPRITTGNTMAPCVIIGERAAEILRAKHRLQSSSIFQRPSNAPASQERVFA